MADVSPATALLARTVQGVWLNTDERETVLAELDELRRKTAGLEQLVCDFQASAMIDVGGMGGPCAVQPRHVTHHVEQLRQEASLAKAALADANAEIARLRSLPFIEFFKPSPASSLDGVVPPPPEGGDAGGVSQPKGAP